MEKVGVRELRLRTTEVLARVQRGETFEVTLRGRAIARLVPASEDSGLAQLIAQGEITGPEDEGDLLDIEPVQPVPGVPLPSEVLAALRADER